MAGETVDDVVRAPSGTSPASLYVEVGDGVVFDIMVIGRLISE